MRMKKPDDIPQDIWVTAGYAICGLRPDREEDMEAMDILSRCVMAERERCEDIARRCPDSHWGPYIAEQIQAGEQ